jgi:hypothetical protein
MSGAARPELRGILVRELNSDQGWGEGIVESKRFFSPQFIQRVVTRSRILDILKEDADLGLRPGLENLATWISENATNIFTAVIFEAVGLEILWLFKHHELTDRSWRSGLTLIKDLKNGDTEVLHFQKGMRSLILKEFKSKMIYTKDDIIPFRYRKKLGEGSYGKVYRVEPDPVLNGFRVSLNIPLQSI